MTPVPANSHLLCDGRRVPVRVERQPAKGAWTARLVESPGVAFTAPDPAEALQDLARFVTTRQRYADLHGI